MTPHSDRIAEKLQSIANDRGNTPAQIALAWLLARREVTAVIIGPDTPEQVDENAGASVLELSPHELAR